jgi:hypothetical protein
MPESLDPVAPPAAARLRSGTAARLAGMAVATLRVWERRYGVVAAPKTPTGQRLYTGHDVQRLRLLKQLTARGHAIGTIAALDLEALQVLALGAPPTPVANPRLVVVGRSAARKLNGIAGCTVSAVHDDLDHAEAQPDASAVAADILLVQLPSLQPAAAERVLALAARLQTTTVLVLYAFGTEAVAESLRAAGVIVRREPVTGRELARLLSLADPRGAPPQQATVPAALEAAPRQFSDEALAWLAEMPSNVSCECPRHLAELVTQLAGFERYSSECLSRNPADAALHRQLTHLAGTTRTLFERALQQVVTDEGIAMP